MISGAPSSAQRGGLSGWAKLLKATSGNRGTALQTEETERPGRLLKRQSKKTQKTDACDGKNKRLADEHGWRLGV